MMVLEMLFQMGILFAQKFIVLTQRIYIGIQIQSNIPYSNLLAVERRFSVHMQRWSNIWNLLGGLEPLWFFHILGIIIPIDQLTNFSEGLKPPTRNQNSKTPSQCQNLDFWCVDHWRPCGPSKPVKFGQTKSNWDMIFSLWTTIFDTTHDLIIIEPLNHYMGI